MAASSYSTFAAGSVCEEEPEAGGDAGATLAPQRHRAALPDTPPSPSSSDEPGGRGQHGVADADAASGPAGPPKSEQAGAECIYYHRYSELLKDPSLTEAELSSMLLSLNDDFVQAAAHFMRVLCVARRWTLRAHLR